MKHKDSNSAGSAESASDLKQALEENEFTGSRQEAKSDQGQQLALITIPHTGGICVLISSAQQSQAVL